MNAFKSKGYTRKMINTIKKYFKLSDLVGPTRKVSRKLNLRNLWNIKRLNINRAPVITELSENKSQ